MRNRNTSALYFTCSSGAYMQDSGGQAGCSGSRGKAPISLSQEWVWSQPRPDPKSDPSFPAALSNTENGGNVHRCKKITNFAQNEKPKFSLMSTSWDQPKKIDFLLQVKPSAVVFDLSLRTLQTGAVSEGTPTQRINFLWTCPAATLCCGAPLVIKNRLLPLWSQGPRSILIYFVLHAVPQGLSGWKSTPITATAEGKRAPFLAGSTSFYWL